MCADTVPPDAAYFRPISASRSLTTPALERVSETPALMLRLIGRLNAPTPFCAPETWSQAGPLWLRPVAGGFCAGLRR